MCGNGATIGLTVAIMPTLRSTIRKVLAQAAVVCCVGADGTMVRGTAASRTAVATIPVTGTATSGCVLLSSIYNVNLLS